MEEKTRTQWYIGAPNGVVLCVRSLRGRELQGELFHSYSLQGSAFENTDQMVRCMERLYDYLHFPHPSTNNRSFIDQPPHYEQRQERKKIMSDENLLSKHGDIGTFIVRVQHRQNSSWQGRITWMEEDKTINFRSVWEMVHLIESAIDTVSPPSPEEGEDPTWFPEK